LACLWASIEYIGHWLALYEASGLDALLALYVRLATPGAPSRRAAGLSRPSGKLAGFTSYEAVRQWIKQRYQRNVTYYTLYTIIATRFKAKLKVPRPATQKNPDAIGRSGDLSKERLQRVSHPRTPARCGCSARTKSRFGLLTVRRRRLTARGVQPSGPAQQVFEWFYVYGAVAPTTGERFFLELPYLNAPELPTLRRRIREAFPRQPKPPAPGVNRSRGAVLVVSMIYRCMGAAILAILAKIKSQHIVFERVISR